MSSVGEAWTPYQAMRALALIEAFRPETLYDASKPRTNLSHLFRIAGVDATATPPTEPRQVVISLDTLHDLPEQAVPGAIKRLAAQCADTLVLMFRPWSDFAELQGDQNTLRPKDWWREQIQNAGLEVLEDLQGLPERLFPRHRTLVGRCRPASRAAKPKAVALEGSGAEYLAFAREAGRAGNLPLAEDSLRHAFAADARPGSEPVFLFSANPWDYLFQRQHQLALEFGRQQGICLYIDPETLRVNVALGAGRDEKQHFLTILLRTLRHVGPGTFAVKFVRQMAFGDEPVREVTSEFFGYLAELTGGTRPLSLFYLPWQDQLAEALASKTTIFYDCVDEFSGFSGAPEGVQQQEQRLLSIADGVFVTAESLRASKGQVAQAIYLVPNGVESGLFEAPAARPPEMEVLPRPVVTFVGGLADWVDLDLVAEAARLRRDWSFVLIGPAFADIQRAAGEPNVRVLGQRQYQELPGYLQASDVGIIPFRLNHLTLNSDPIKCYEYMAAGLPVISTDLPPMRRFAERGLLSVVGSAQQLIESVESEIALPPEEREARRLARLQAARRESWQRRARVMLCIMRGHARLLEGQWTGAAELFSLALEDTDNPGRLELDARAAAVIAEAAASRGEAPNRGRESDSARDELHLLGFEWFNRGRLASAGRLFSLLADGDPGDADVWFNLATVRVAEKRWPEALEALRHCRSGLGTSPDYLLLLGPVLANLGHVSAAKQVLSVLSGQGSGLPSDEATRGLELLSSLSGETTPPEWVEDLVRSLTMHTA